MEIKNIPVTVTMVMLVTVITLFVPVHVHAVDKNSNYYKNCIKMTDKRIRSIECPDVFSKSESSFVPGG